MRRGMVSATDVRTHRGRDTRQDIGNGRGVPMNMEDRNA